MTSNRRSMRTILLGATALAGALALSATQASAQERRYEFDVPAQPLNAALQTFARQAQLQVIFAEAETKNLSAPPLNGSYSADEALQVLLAGTELKVSRTSKGVLQIAANADPQSGSAAGDGADQGTVQALIVTAQKREEDIQDVPIAISAFTQEDLTRSQVAGGADLMTQVPNMTFTKTNFSSYSIQIRGIGTQAISATTDPAVAVAFNNTPFVRNHFFEQEFYDLERVEVLRGPQGTLYGRNATAGVVNIISAKPKFRYEAKLSADVANYNSTRFEGMINIPLVEDAVALRMAGAWTKRDGFVTNQNGGQAIDGRDLWSTRVSLRIAPQDAHFDANLIWEHFEENDDRLRSGKQLCKTHTVTELHGPNGVVVPIDPTNSRGNGIQSLEGIYSQGCTAVSLYSPEAFQVPQGWALPYWQGLFALGLRVKDENPYATATQSHDLRVIESTVEPQYRANNNVFELQANFDLTSHLRLTSETAYSTDELFSLQDLNRFNTRPGLFPDRNYGFDPPAADAFAAQFPGYNIYKAGPDGGIFCDPQIGCADRLVAEDLSTADSTQFSQELRLASDFAGPFNFSIGANFLRNDSLDKYYVFINTLTQALASLTGVGVVVQPGDQPPPWIPGVADNRACSNDAWLPPDPNSVQNVPLNGICAYIDPNPIGSLNDQGHNYFLSKNPYKLISYAVFGEAYYNITPNLKVTGGVRWTVDKKEAPRLPSMLLAGDSIGLSVAEVSEQEWREPTGRLTVDWKPDLSFTDETLLYASFAHGYKAGGANPPATAPILYAGQSDDTQAAILDRYATFPPTFEPEFIDAYEVGSKNTLLDGKLTLNTSGFYYNYKNYQISEIVERAALNRNFDAKVWGAELEAEWRPAENLRLSFKGGYEKTRIADGEQAIDLMDRTAGDPNWVVIRPFPTNPSNCVIPTSLATWNGQPFVGIDFLGICERILAGNDPVTDLPYVENPTLRRGDSGTGTASLFDQYCPITGCFPANYWRGYPGYDPRSANNSQGIYKQLGGNELPNAPKWTTTLSADYTLPLPNEWLMSLHGDFHWQSGSYWRVFNDLDYDKLQGFSVVNLAAIFTNEDAGWNVMAYVKNALDNDAITGAFLFSDDTGLTTNVFLTEPRLYGLRVTKAWSGGPLIGGFGARHEGPYPFTVEFGGQVQRHDAPYSTIEPSFTSLFPAQIDPLATQHQKLDWGDGREVKLTYDPRSNWKVTLGARYGKTNGVAKSIVGMQDPDYSCRGYYKYGQSAPPCPPDKYKFHDHNYENSTIRTKVEHTVVDFDVRRDVGLGLLGNESSGSVGLGLRYADLRSETDAHIFGIPDWIMPPDIFVIYPDFTYSIASTRHTEYDASLIAKREFKGAGPTLSWEQSTKLLGNSELGRLSLDTALSGGVLFGKTKTSITGDEKADYFHAKFLYNFTSPDQSTTTPIDIHRSKSRTVPVADLSLGLSYSVDRFKMGAGYRWERYFNAIDGGYQQSDQKDRTIDGPYFKIAVGFGG